MASDAVLLGHPIVALRLRPENRVPIVRQLPRLLPQSKGEGVVYSEVVVGACCQFKVAAALVCSDCLIKGQGNDQTPGHTYIVNTLPAMESTAFQDASKNDVDIALRSLMLMTLLTERITSGTFSEQKTRFGRSPDSLTSR